MAYWTSTGLGRVRHDQFMLSLFPLDGLSDLLHQLKELFTAFLTTIHDTILHNLMSTTWRCMRVSLRQASSIMDVTRGWRSISMYIDNSFDDENDDGN